MRNVCLIIIAIGLFASCNKKEDPFPSKMGFLQLDLKVNLSIAETDGRMMQVDAGEFAIGIFDTEHNQVLAFEKAKDMPLLIELPVGQYYVAANSNNLVPAAFDAPFYAGQSTIFAIEAQQTSQTVVDCSLANCMATIEYSDFVKANFDSWETEISVTGGSLHFDQDETRAGYFKLTPMDIASELRYNGGSIKTISGKIPDPKPKTLYRILIDASTVDGDVGIDIAIDEEVDTVRLTFNRNMIAPSEGDTINADQLQYGDLLITEIMFDPDAMDDTRGEWFEIFNATKYSVNINGLMFNDEYSEITIEGDLFIEPSGYFAIAKTDTAFLAPDYVMSKLSLHNEGEIIKLVSPQEQDIVVVDYTGIPKTAGASLNLCRDHFSADEAQLPENWCKSETPYNTGDLGTPGYENTACH